MITILKARTTIGRDERNDIAIPKPTISSFHATIECKNMVYYLEDQRSTNGSFLNGRRLHAKRESLRLFAASLELRQVLLSIV